MNIKDAQIPTSTNAAFTNSSIDLSLTLLQLSKVLICMCCKIRIPWDPVCDHSHSFGLVSGLYQLLQETSGSSSAKLQSLEFQDFRRPLALSYSFY